MSNEDIRKAPTMHDVARLAGVSQTTVSFVINDKPNISIAEETRQRIWDAVEQLGYRPNVVAQSLRTSQTHLIGLISDEIATTPHAGQIIEGAQDVAWNHGKLLILINTGGREEIKQAAINMMLDRQVEGIVYATMYHREVQASPALRRVPAVLLDCFVADHSLPSVVPDEVQGGRSATAYLLSRGHRRIGFLNNSDPIPATRGRLQGYREALAMAGVAYDEDLVVADSSDSEGGYRAATTLMQRPDPPTALFCFNDRMAMGAYDAVRKLGLAIPDDVAIMGFDNQELIAAHLYPPLTTVQLPHYEMGQWALTYLIEQTAGDTAGPAIQQRLECPLVIRASV